MGVFLPSVSSIFDPKVNDNNVVWDSRVALDLLDLSIPFSIFSPKQKMILSQGGFTTQRSRVFQIVQPVNFLTGKHLRSQWRLSWNKNLLPSTETWLFNRDPNLAWLIIIPKYPV